MIIRSFLKDQTRLFWVLHLGGWLAWGLIVKYAFTRALFGDTAPGYLMYVMVITVIGIVISRAADDLPVLVESTGLGTSSRFSRWLWNGRIFVAGVPQFHLLSLV